MSSKHTVGHVVEDTASRGERGETVVPANFACPCCGKALPITIVVKNRSEQDVRLHVRMISEVVVVEDVKSKDQS